jgi:hypothetical protein
MIIQEDDGEVVGANSYVSIDEYVNYFASRNIDLSSQTDGQLEADLIAATFYLDTLNNYCGYKLNGRNQTTEFPRAELYDCSGSSPELVEGVPREIKEAQCEYANIHSAQGTLQPNEALTGGIKKEKKGIGSLSKETEYCGCASSGGVISYPVADNKIPDDFKCNSNGELIHE